MNFNTVDEYIALFPKDVQIILAELRRTILAAAPIAVEKISYKMAAYSLNGPVVYFAAYKNHIGLYATASANPNFKNELKGYKIGKGSIQFPIDKPLPLDLVTRIVKFKVNENLSNNKSKK